MKFINYLILAALTTILLLSISSLPACNTKPTSLKGKISQSMREQVDEQWKAHMLKVDSFEFDNLYILSGEPVTLRWKVSQADNVTISNRQGTIEPSAGKLGLVGPEGSMQFVFPRAGKSNMTEYAYTLTAVNSYGKVTGNAMVMVEDDDQPPGIYLEGSPTRMKLGKGAHLEWNVSFADDVKMDDGSGNFTAIEHMGEKIVNPSKTTAYTITAVNKAGKSVKSIVIEVVPADD